MAQEHSSIGFADLMASSVHDMKNSLNVQIGALEQLSRQRSAAGDQASCQALGGVIHESHRMHACLVQFTHPFTGEIIRRESPLPPALAALLEG